MFLCLRGQQTRENNHLQREKKPASTQLNSVQCLLLGMGPRDNFLIPHSQAARIKDINSQGKLEDKAEEMLNIHFPLQFSYYVHSGNILTKL